MKATKPEVFAEDPSPILLKKLNVRALEPEEHARAAELLKQEHYLGDVPNGRSLVQVVEYEGAWVALLDWGPAAHKLADRDEWIGWSGRQRAERLKLVVMNRRFLILGKGRMPNLASKSLALALKALPGHWERRHGYRPVLAETFTDIERFEGTCYKASNWLECGRTKGFERHRMEYYRKNGRPKKLWLKSLNRNARSILTSMDLPEAYRAAANPSSSERDLPLKKPQLVSLLDWMREHLEDPRASNRMFPASSLLALVAMALLAGRRNLSEIHRYGQFMSPAQRRWLEWPLDKGGKGRRAPSYTALRNLLIQIDPHLFARSMSEWLQSHQGTLPRALAVDGKWIGDQLLSLCLSDHETGAPVAIGFARIKPGSQERKKEGEQAIARRLYEETNLENATITGDALFNNRPQAEAIVRNGADYVLQLKDENRNSYKKACQSARSTPLFSTPKNPNAGTDDSISAP